jgi:hypothetical protein
MKRLFFGFTIAVLIAGSQALRGEQSRNPFIDHSDTGETVHVLPAPAAVHSPHATQPTDAPASQGLAVYPYSYGSGTLINHGGPQISLAGFYAIYWNSAVASSTINGKTLETTVNAFVNSFSGSPDYTIIQQYGTANAISPMVAWAGELIDAQPTQSMISDSKVQNYLASLFNSTRVGADVNTLYGVYFPSGMRISLQGGVSCSSFCGYHGHFTYTSNGTSKDIKYAVFPYTNCSACSMPGKTVFDIMTIVGSHEIREAVTDPDLNAWFDSAGYEADDKCAWHNLYRTSAGFMVQPEYSNGGNGYPGPGCIVP